MSTPEQNRPRDGVPAAPRVSTAPAIGDTTTPDVAPGHRWWSAIPRHLGRARTSTVVLGLLFVVVFTLYLNVRPPAEGSPPVAPADSVEEPVTTTEQTEPTGTGTGAETETETTAPTTTAPRTTTGSPSPTTTAPSSPDTGSTESTTPETTAPAPTGGTEDGTAPDTPTG